MKLIFPLIVIVVIGTGWVQNLLKLSDCDFQPSYKAEVIYGAGLIPIVGAVTGWMDFGK